MALGALGQYIVVVPENEMVVVFTSDLPESFSVPRNLVDEFIVPVAKSRTPLPANPDGVARLRTLIQEAARQSEVTPQPMPPPPAIAEQVLGETYYLEENELQWESLSLVRQEGDEAILRLTWDETVSSPRLSTSSGWTASSVWARACLAWPQPVREIGRGRTSLSRRSMESAISSSGD